MSDHLMTEVDAYAPTPDQARAAAATIAAFATDDVEARTFCRQLGLLPTVTEHPDPRDRHGRRYGRRTK